MKVIVFTDVHANLPALQAALKAVHQEGCDALVHTGDAIAIGPHPAECLDTLLGTENVQFVMGNHDAWLAHGLPEPQPSWMSDGEVEHQCWTHAQIDPQLRSVVAQWPYVLTQELSGVQVTFVHYPLRKDSQEFAPIIKQPARSDLDLLFEQHDSAAVFYGHDHSFSDVQGKARYVNPGSLGCHTEAVARFTVVECDKGRFTVEHRRVPYDDTAVFSAFEERQVPEDAFLCRVFFGGRNAV